MCKLEEALNRHDFEACNGRYQVFEERAYLVGIERKGAGPRSSFGIAESLEELAQLADTAGLTVMGTTYQKYVFTLS
jgi:GTP-binding protein HflX